VVSTHSRHAVHSTGSRTAPAGHSEAAPLS
jgi:hypothetical protein